MTDRFVTEREAAMFLAVSVATLRKWRAKGDGPAWHKFGRAVRYRLSDLEAFTEKARVKESAQPRHFAGAMQI